MALSREEVRHVALLARLELSDEELDRFTAQLGRIVEYVEQLRQLQTDDVPPRISAAAEGNVFRADEPRPGLAREAFLSQAPATDGEHFLVPPVLDPGGGAA